MMGAALKAETLEHPKHWVDWNRMLTATPHPISRGSVLPPITLLKR